MLSVAGSRLTITGSPDPTAQVSLWNSETLSELPVLGYREESTTFLSYLDRGEEEPWMSKGASSSLAGEVLYHIISTVRVWAIQILDTRAYNF